MTDKKSSESGRKLLKPLPQAVVQSLQVNHCQNHGVAQWSIR